jgi:hypothetical protein
MNKLLKRSLKLLGTRLLFVALSVFFIMPFSWLINFENGFFYYSILASVFYLGYVYSDLHAEGAKDVRRKCAMPLNGLLAGALSEVITLCLIIVLVLCGGGKAFGRLNIVFLAWAAPFIGFLDLPSGEILSMTKITANYYYALIPVPVVSALGYIAGMRGIYFLAKRKCNVKKQGGM